MGVPIYDSVKSVTRGRETVRKAVKGTGCLALFGALVVLAGCPNPGGGKTDPTKPATKPVTEPTTGSTQPGIFVGDISVSLNENGPETVVTLPYKSQGGAVPTSCEVYSVQVPVTRDCACSAGVCTVGIQPPPTVYGGSFGFSLSDKNGISSNTGKARVKVLEVSLVVHDGNGQVGTVGEKLDKPLIVFARNSEGIAVPGVDVFWEPELAIKKTKAIGWEEWDEVMLGSTASCKGKTDDKGLARCTWTLGTRIPVTRGNYKIRKVNASAFSANEDKQAHRASFTATVNPGRAARLSFLNQSYSIQGEQGICISPAIYYGPETPWWRVPLKNETAGAALGRAWLNIPAAVVVFARDEYGNAATVGGGITLTLAIKEGGAKLQGTTSVKIENAEIGAVTDAAVGTDIADAVRWKQGLAVFSNVYLTKSGKHVLTVTAQPGGTGLVVVDAEGDFGSFFTVDPGPANKLKFSIQPGGARAGEPLTTQPVVNVLDEYDNIVTTLTSNSANQAEVSVSLVAPTAPDLSPGTLGGGGTTVGVVNGVATFTGLKVDKAGVGYRLTASGKTELAPAPNLTSTKVLQATTSLGFTIE